MRAQRSSPAVSMVRTVSSPFLFLVDKIRLGSTVGLLACGQRQKLLLLRGPVPDLCRTSCVLVTDPCCQVYLDFGIQAAGHKEQWRPKAVVYGAKVLEDLSVVFAAACVLPQRPCMKESAAEPPKFLLQQDGSQAPQPVSSRCCPQFILSGRC